MKNLKLMIVLYTLGGSVYAQKANSTLYTISGKVTQTSSYCGGAAPTQEMMENYNTPSKYTGKVFYIRKGRTNTTKQPIVLKFISDSSGNFSFKLPPGDYIIIQKEQVKPLNFKNIRLGFQISLDKPCLKEWWKKPFSILEVQEKDIQNLNFNFHHSCFLPGDLPCRNYTGPLPP